MKRITLVFFLSFITIQGFAQRMITLYAGAGLATANNYDVGITGGLKYMKFLFNRTAVGVNLSYQAYGIEFDNEAYGVKGGIGNAGVIVLNKSSYAFLSPELNHFFGKHGFFSAYVNAGVGYNVGGTETMRKWDNSFGAGGGNFDSTLETTKNINKMLMRIGFGFTQHIHIGDETDRWWFSISEDFGFVTKNLSTTSDVTDFSRTQYSPHKMRPGVISLRVGIMHQKVRKF